MNPADTITPGHSPEGLILTRLFTAQRRLRFMRSAKAGLIWFGLGTILACFALVLIWNWNYLPGPWQWLASGDRPREVLWLPLLIGLGGFASRWFILPNSRQSAYLLDRLFDSQERILTAVDWILSEKPRTEAAERVVAQAAKLVSDEVKFNKTVKNLGGFSRKYFAILLTGLFPLLALFYLPAHTQLPPSASVWLGESQVDQLTEDLLQELEDTQDIDKMEEKLQELLKELENTDPDQELSEEQKEAQKQLQEIVDQMAQQAEAQEKARELLETLAQRARQGQQMSEQDKKALEALRQNLTDKDQQNQLDQAEQDWKNGEFDKAAEGMESLQRQVGENAQSLSESAKESGAQGGLEPDDGQEFNEQEGDQFDADGTAKGEGKGKGQGKGQGEGEGTGDGQGEGDGSGEGQGQGDKNGPGVGEGTTLEDQGDQGGAKGRQSYRRSDKESDWMEEYEHLHAPERSKYDKAQTRIEGQMGEDGPRFHTSKEGIGAVTEPSDRQGSGGILRYQQEAENAILREEVPADYRDNVRVYFEGLDKGR